MANGRRKGQQCTCLGKTLTLRIPVDSVPTCASSGDQKASFRVLTKARRGQEGRCCWGCITEASPRAGGEREAPRPPLLLSQPREVMDLAEEETEAQLRDAP